MRAKLCVATKILNLKAIPSGIENVVRFLKLCVATKILNLKAIPSLVAMKDIEG